MNCNKKTMTGVGRQIVSLLLALVLLLQLAPMGQPVARAEDAGQTEEAEAVPAEGGEPGGETGQTDESGEKRQKGDASK